MAGNTIFIRRVIIRNYKSIANCDVTLGPLTWLVGANGSGKSNFLDALHFVRDSLDNSLENALRERGGISEVRRRSSGHPTHFGLRVEFILPDGSNGMYAFNVAALPNNAYEVQKEECRIGKNKQGPHFLIERGILKDTSEAIMPKTLPDRLALVSVSGLAAFRPLHDALVGMSFYNLNPKTIREPQKPQDGRFLRSAGENLASVIAHLKNSAPESLNLIQEYLKKVVPSVHSLERKAIGPMETLTFKQDVKGGKYPWEFYAQNMSDGTLRATGVLTSLFQTSENQRPSLVGIEEPETALHPAASAALREALVRSSKQTQVIVTSHSPDLLDDSGIDSSSILAVVAEGGETKIAKIDNSSREALNTHLTTAGELLRLNQIQPDKTVLDAQSQRQPDLFAQDIE